MMHLLSNMFKNIDRKTLFFGLAEISVIIFFAWLAIFRKPAPEIKVIDNRKQYEEVIKQLLTKIDVVQERLDKRNASFDSLKFQDKQTIKYFQNKRQYEKTAPIDTVASFLHSRLKGAK